MKRLLVLSAAAFLLLSSACLTEKQAPENVFNKSTEAMANVGSYSFGVHSAVAFRTQSQITGSSMSEMGFYWNGSVDEGEKKMRVQLRMDAELSDDSTEKYVVSGVQYTKVPVFGWVKNQTPEDFWSRQDYAMMRPGPADVRAASLSEEEIGGVGYYVVDVNMSAEEFMDLLSRQMGSAKPSAEELTAVRGFGFREWIAKDTFLVRRRVMQVRFFSDRYDASVNTTMDFFYDGVVDIELPAEARYALDMDALASGFVSP
jgi:hypothetical protein